MYPPDIGAFFQKYADIAAIYGMRNDSSQKTKFCRHSRLVSPNHKIKLITKKVGTEPQVRLPPINCLFM
jgi:hypothetical protein